MAAPVVGNIFADVLPYMGVQPELSDEENGDVQMPELYGMSLYEAKEKLKDEGLDCRTIGNGETVTAQLPAPDIKIARGTQIILYLDEEPSQELETVPNLNGLSYEEARDTLSYYGIYIQTASPVSNTDWHTVSTQSIAAGTQVGHGSVISVTLISSDESLLGRY